MSVLSGGGGELSTARPFPSHDSLRSASLQELYDHISSIISKCDENFFSFIVLFRAYFLSSKLDK
jgi:hypothetical protein